MNYKTLPFLLLLGCGGAETTDTDVALQYFAHPCGNGDPVHFECATDLTEVELDDADWPLCTDDGVAAEDPCDSDGDQCVIDPAVACDDDPTTQVRSAAYLFCQAEDFEDEQCPQSSRTIKDNVHYLTESERKGLAAKVLDLDIASYTYTEGTGATGEQMGFIIEDAPEAPFLQQDGERVNLYAYISSVVATVQQQQTEISALRAEITALSTECQQPSVKESRQTQDPFPSP